MSKILRKHSRKIGLPPGSIIYTGQPTDNEIEFSIIDYDAGYCIDALLLPA
jgi:hypothetical protein